MSTAQRKTSIELYRLGVAALDQLLGPVESLRFLHVSSGDHTAEAGAGLTWKIEVTPVMAGAPRVDMMNLRFQ